MAKKAIVLLADGFEDVEAITPIDYLRRAGIEVTTVSISENLTVTSRWGQIKVTAETTLAQIAGQSNWDAVIVPGGMPGAANLSASKETALLLKEMSSAGKVICAICASPAVVLSPLGLLDGKNFTCYPGMEEKVTTGKWSGERVVTDGNIITSRGAGTAGEFAIAIINKLLDEATGRKIAEAVLLLPSCCISG
ncbi:MAG: DJ-1/PfpI family protein [Treponema sp.]|jgi:4-methyl-5(b-hydroxyethyl)-thiazole monophosphate biosynthesis|nr:DJ-1/PfpI family protein [Treponema sp.]